MTGATAMLQHACGGSTLARLHARPRTPLGLRGGASRGLQHGSGLQSRRLQTTPQALFKNLGLGKKAAPAKAAKRETVVPAPSYNIPAVLLGVAGLSAYENNLVAAGIFGVLGVFLGIQAGRVRFIFDDTSLQVKIGNSDDETENAFVGGANRSEYDSFTNWEFWWPNFPVLVYFKETQTKPEGQIHFFPIIFDGKAIYNVMVERCGPSKGSLPK